MKETIPYHRPIRLTEIDIEFIQDNIKKILKSGKFKNLNWVPALEEIIRELYDVEYVISTSSCTMGLYISLLYLNPSIIQVPMFNWWSVLYILKALKHNIVWNDIDINTWLPIERYNTPSLYLNTFGNIGKSKKKDAIYDSSHCLGAKIEDMGLVHVFSLAPTKLITSGEGGIIITNNEYFYKYVIEQRDKICRMDEVRALIGCVYFQYLDIILSWKKMLYDYYKKNIPGQFQEIKNNSAYNTIGFLNITNLKIPKHIKTKQYYEPIWDNGIKNNTKKIYKQMICLPSYYECPYKQIVEDIKELNDF